MMQVKYLISAQIITILLCKLSYAYHHLFDSHTPKDLIVKRAEIPDLNDFPPEEEESVGHPAYNNHFGLRPIATIKKPRSKMSIHVDTTAMPTLKL